MRHSRPGVIRTGVFHFFRERERGNGGFLWGVGIEEEREGVRERERECVREVSFEWESYSRVESR